MQHVDVQILFASEKVLREKVGIHLRIPCSIVTKTEPEPVKLASPTGSEPDRFKPTP